MGFAPESPAAARAGGMVCTKIKTEKFYETKTAGGCGVAPFPSLPSLFRGAVTAQVGRWRRDLIRGNEGRGSSVGWRTAALAASGDGCINAKKPPGVSRWLDSRFRPYRKARISSRTTIAALRTTIAVSMKLFIRVLLISGAR